VAISFVGSAVGSASPNGTFNVTLPVGCQADDLILVAFAVGDSAGADNDLAVNGFTEVSDLSITTDTNDTEMFVGYRYFVNGDTQVPASGNFTALGGTNASNAAVVMVFRGVATAADGGPFSTTATTATGIDTSDADPPSIATAATDWIVIAGATGHTGGATAAYTAPTNYTTNFAQRAHNDTVDVLVGMGYRSSGFSNPENPGVMTAATVGTASANSWCATTMALKEAPTTRRARIAWAELEVLDVPAAWPAAPVKETFTYSNGSVEGQGDWVDWPLITNGLDVNSNAVRAATAVNLCGSLYARSQGADIEIYATITELVGEGFGMGMTWRQSTTVSTDTRYYFDLNRVAGTNNDTMGFGKAVAGSYTTDIGGIINLGFDAAVGDQVGVRMVGSSVEFWYKRSGGSWNRVATRTDSSISAAGYAGLFIDRQPGKWDDFSYSTYPPRQSRVAFAELETPNAPRRARVAFTELEVPTAPRRARVAFAELEAPNAPRRARVAFAELEVPDLAVNDRRARVAFAELETPSAPRRARVAFAELEIPTAPRRARVAFAELQVADAPRRARVAFAELEVPLFTRRAQIAWADLEVPNVPGAVTDTIVYTIIYRVRGR
jgi:hypothetical protein